ncbi:MAG TPA: hypothetical protein VIG24_01790 [Acidimicrobiia bacterium]
MSVVKKLSEPTAHDIIWMFERTYRLEAGRFVNKVGEEASQRTLDLVAEAQAALA